MVGGMEGHAATIRVGPREEIKSIKTAVAKAKSGDTVRVIGGEYAEGNIVIRTSLTLVGEGHPVIDGEKAHEPISILAPNVTIDGFTIKASGHSSLRDIAGIKIYDTYGAVIRNNILDDNFFGIYAQNAKNCRIENNQLTAYGKAEQLIGNGLHAWKCDSLTITGNTVNGHRDGIYLEFVTATNVDGNQAVHNLRYGLHFMFSHENSYRGNTFTANGAGVAVMYTRDVHMENNVFDKNWGDAAYGLLLKDITDSHIENNIFLGNTTGIYMEGSNRVQIQRNQFEANGWAIKILGSCMDNTFTANNFVQNTFDIATNATRIRNTFERNYWDKYEGYDLDRDRIGDIPYRPVSLYSILVERYPVSMILFRSFMVTLLDRTERLIPSLTPEALKDDYPLMKPIDL